MNHNMEDIVGYINGMLKYFGNKNIQFDAEIMDFTYNLMNKVGLTNVSIEFGHRKIVEDYIRTILKITDNNSIDEMLRIMDKKGKKNINELTIEAKNKNIDETKFIQLLEFFEINNNDEILSELNKFAIDVTENNTKFLNRLIIEKLEILI